MSDAEVLNKDKKEKPKQDDEVIKTADGVVFNKKKKTLAGPDGKVYGEFL
jgi:hypothetical protein